LGQQRYTGCVGLENQGATSYMTSILQLMFFTKKMRRAVYQMTPDENNKDFFVSLQKLFFQLQFCDKPVSTKALTRSFGMRGRDLFEPNDIHEFSRIFVDYMERKMENTAIEDTIPSLYKDQMRSFIRCVNVVFEDVRFEDFYDLQLDVIGMPDGEFGLIKSVNSDYF
jgi:ubiquitin carboxyl-terminal hydrolase 7